MLCQLQRTASLDACVSMAEVALLKFFKIRSLPFRTTQHAGDIFPWSKSVFVSFASPIIECTVPPCEKLQGPQLDSHKITSYSTVNSRVFGGV